MDTKDNYTELERIEDKYIIAKQNFTFFEALAVQHMSPGYSSKNTKYILINTQYFDTSDLKCFRDHITKQKDRFKIRIRSYGPNGTWKKDEVFLEIKEKKEGKVHKFRIRIDPENVKKISGGNFLEFSDFLLKENKHLYTKNKLKEFVDGYNKIVFEHNHDIHPSVSLTYRRLAFGKGKNFRITLDQNVKARLARELTPALEALTRSPEWQVAREMHSKYKPSMNAVMETKYQGVNFLPEWLENTFDELDMDPESFSKYVWAVVESIQSK